MDAGVPIFTRNTWMYFDIRSIFAFNSMYLTVEVALCAPIRIQIEFVFIEIFRLISNRRAFESQTLYLLFSINSSNIWINAKISAIFHSLIKNTTIPHSVAFDAKKLVPYSKIESALNRKNAEVDRNNWRIGKKMSEFLQLNGIWPDCVGKKPIVRYNSFKNWNNFTERFMTEWRLDLVELHLKLFRYGDKIMICIFFHYVPDICVLRIFSNKFGLLIKGWNWYYTFKPNINLFEFFRQTCRRGTTSTNI